MKLICIDLDNTLADTTKMHLIAFRKAFWHYGLKPSEKQILHLFGLPSEEMVKKLYPSLASYAVIKIARLHNKIAIKSTYRHAKILKGARQALQYLKSKGYKIAIISNSSLREIKKVLGCIKLSKRLYDKIISKEDVPRGKPSPGGINLAKRLFKSKKIIMVGDTPYDLMAGRRANAKTIAVTTGSYSKKELKKYHPSFILRSIADIKEAIQ